ncbi:MAG: alpha-L-rhamnosidase, partial [Bacteroidota bacterium]
MKRFVLFVVSLLFFTVPAICQLSISEMFTENRKTPMGLDEPHPRFSWIIDSDQRQVLQTAYEIRVAENAGDFESGEAISWSSGRVKSSQSVHVPYSGQSLETGTRYYWQVRVWDNRGNESGWSEISWWQTGLMNNSAWKADWISGLQNGDVNVSFF